MSADPPLQPPTFDPKSVPVLDWAVLAAGVVAFLFSLVSYYSMTGPGVLLTANAWHGFFGWFAAVLAVVGSGALVVENFYPSLTLPVTNRVLGVASYAIATLGAGIAGFIVPSSFCSAGACNDVPPGFVKGHAYGYWVSFAAIIAGVVLSAVQLRQARGDRRVRTRRSRP